MQGERHTPRSLSNAHETASPILVVNAGKSKVILQQNTAIVLGILVEEYLHGRGAAAHTLRSPPCSANNPTTPAAWPSTTTTSPAWNGSTRSTLPSPHWKWKGGVPSLSQSKPCLESLSLSLAAAVCVCACARMTHPAAAAAAAPGCADRCATTHVQFSQTQPTTPKHLLETLMGWYFPSRGGLQARGASAAGVEWAMVRSSALPGSLRIPVHALHSSFFLPISRKVHNVKACFLESLAQSLEEAHSIIEWLRKATTATHFYAPASKTTTHPPPRWCLHVLYRARPSPTTGRCGRVSRVKVESGAAHGFSPSSASGRSLKDLGNVATKCACWAVPRFARPSCCAHAFPGKTHVTALYANGYMRF